MTSSFSFLLTIMHFDFECIPFSSSHLHSCVNSSVVRLSVIFFERTWIKFLRAGGLAFMKLVELKTLPLFYKQTHMTDFLNIPSNYLGKDYSSVLQKFKPFPFDWFQSPCYCTHFSQHCHHCWKHFWKQFLEWWVTVSSHTTWSLTATFSVWKIA